MTRLIVGAVLAALLIPLLARSAPQSGVLIEKYKGHASSDSPYIVTTISLLNQSHKDITAIALAVRVNNPDGTLGAPTVYGQNLLEPYIHGDRPFPPDAVFDMDITQTGSPNTMPTITATVALIVYADKTAEVTDNDIFQSIMRDRAGQAQAMQQINGILSTALADPSIDPVQKLNELLASDATTSGGYVLEIKTALQNLNRTDKQAAMRSVLAGNQQRLPMWTEHAQLTKEVQP